MPEEGHDGSPGLWPPASPANAAADGVVFGQMEGFGEAAAKPAGFGAPSSIMQGWDQWSSGAALGGEGVSHHVPRFLSAVTKG